MLTDMIINCIVVQKTPPTQKNVLWVRLVDEKATLYIFNNGRWQPMRLMDDKGTATTDDDVIEDISDIEGTVREEVTKQVEVIEKGMVNSKDSPDGSEYPDVNM